MDPLTFAFAALLNAAPANCDYRIEQRPVTGETNGPAVVYADMGVGQPDRFDIAAVQAECIERPDPQQIGVLQDFRDHEGQ